MVKYVKANSDVPNGWYWETYDSYISETGTPNNDFGRIFLNFWEIVQGWNQGSDKFSWDGSNGHSSLTRFGYQLVKYCPEAEDWLTDLSMAGRNGKYKTYAKALEAFENNMYHYLIDHKDELTK